MSKPSLRHTFQALLWDWGVIVALFVIAIQWPQPIVWICVFLWMSRQQLGLAILMHDAAHKRLATDVRLNDWLSQFFCAAPLLFSMYSYRTLHLKHHQDPLAADDPDLSLIGGYPISKKSFLRKLIRDATGISYFKFIRYFIHAARKPKRQVDTANQGEKKVRAKTPVGEIVFSILFMNGLMFFILWQLGHPIYYFTLWFLPAVTALQVLLRIRGVAEHAGYSQNQDQRVNARTLKPSWQTLIFAPHHVNYHIEHHIYPSVPYFRLPQLHRMMSERGELPVKNIFTGYGPVLKEIVKS